MELSSFINRRIYGNQFDSVNYDESMPLSELQEKGFPYSMACININKSSIIAVDCGEKLPGDFIRENQYKQFVLDASKHPRNIDSMLGNKNVFYLKEFVGEFQKNEYQWNQFTIIGFKEDGNISGAPIDGSFTQLQLM